jgi:hypothetical protein
MDEDEMLAWQLQNDELLEANLQTWNLIEMTDLHNVLRTDVVEENPKDCDNSTIQMRLLKHEQDQEYQETLKKDRQTMFERQIRKIPPPHFICQISGKIMKIPLCDLEDGVSYEKHVILDFLKTNGNQNMHGKHIDKTKLVINNNLKNEIGLWLREHA